MSWLKFLDEQAISNPKKIAIIDKNKGRSLSYEELKTETQNWVGYLCDQGVTKDDTVAYYCTNSLEHITIFFACARIGAIFFPLNFRLAIDELREVICEISPRLLINGEDMPLNLGGKEIMLSSVILKTSKELKFTELDDKASSLVLFTSGSSGKPKGVLLHNQMLRRNQSDTAQEWNLNSSDIAVIETPFFHTGGYNVFCLPILSLGGTIIISKKFNPDYFFNTNKNERISVYFGVPTMFQTIREDIRFDNSDLSHIRFVISGGAYCPEDLIRTYQARGILFKQGFGLTEVGPNCFLLNDCDALRKIGSIGKPMGASQVRLINQDSKDVLDGSIGELLLKGENLCKGFYKNIELFKNSLTDGYYHTGDLAYRDSDGFFFIAGRKKEMYISGGENVYPAEVERRVQRHPSIDGVVIVPIPDEKWGEVGHAFIRSKNVVNIEELRTYLNPLLARYKHPYSLKNIDVFPLLENGKIDKLKLKKMAIQDLGIIK